MGLKSLIKRDKERRRLSIRHLVLAAIASLGGKAPRREYIHKILYALVRHHPELEDILLFESYRRGPWSEAVADTLDALIDEGVIEVTTGEGLVLNEELSRVKSSLSRVIPQSILEDLEEIGELFSQMSLDELLLYVYTIYGGHENSEIKDRVFRKRRELAISMLKKGLISTGLAAKLAGMSYREFIQYLRRKGIKPYVAEESDIDKAANISI